MAIKGLTPQLAERGKIKIGGLGEERKKQGSNETYRLPVKHDYITITTMQRDAAGRLMQDTDLMNRLKQEQHIEKLTEIPVRLLYDDIDLNFLTRYSCYIGTRCWCTGDGEQAERYSDKSGKYEPVACPCERSDPTYPKADKCKTLGTLQVLLQGVDRVGGVWKFRTTSWNTVNAILSSLALIKTITGGPLAGIPLWMVLSPKTVTVPAGPQQGRSMVVYVVSLEYRGPEERLAELGYDIAKRRIEHRIKMEHVEAEARRLLVAPHQESLQDQAETAAEFYPGGAKPGGNGSEGTVKADPIPPESEPQALSEAAPGPQGGTPSPTSAPEPEDSMAPGSHSEAGGNGEGQALARAYTLPELMEWFRCIPEDHGLKVPQPLATSKGVRIGELVSASELVKEPGCWSIVIEVVPNLEEVADGLTPEMIARSFNEAGIQTRVQRQGAASQIHEELPAAPPPQEKPAAKPRGARKSLF